MGLKRANVPDELVELLAQPDAGSVPDASGRRRCVVRCRVPFAFEAGSPSRAPIAIPVQRAEGDASSDDQGMEIIEGIASSTSVDWYGTRMTKECLDGMGAQFSAGIDYLPRHHSWNETIEWDGVIGRTFESEVRRGQVKEPKDGESSADQWILNVRTKLWMRKELARELVACIVDGRGPGQSIGGWFTQIAVTYDEDGWPVYPIDVLEVQLDHLAAVRSPANPDAEAVFLALRQKLEAAGRTAFAPGQPATREAPATTERVVVTTTSDSEPLALRGRDLGPATPNTSGEGATAPVPDPVPPQRAMESDMDPKQFEEMMARALAPLTTRLDAIEARNATQAPPAPVQPPAPVERQAPTPNMADYWQARATAAEAQNAAMIAAAGNPPAPGQRAAAAPTPAPDQSVPLLFRTRLNMDARTIAPKACKEAARVGAEEVTAYSVLQHDGMKALAQFARANGEGRSLADVVESHPDLADRSTRVLRKRDTEDLRSLLSDVIFAGIQDGVVGKKIETWF